MDGYVVFLAACLNAEVSGMNAENMQRQCNGESMAYTEDSYIHTMNSYKKLLDEYYKSLSQESNKQECKGVYNLEKPIKMFLG